MSAGKKPALALVEGGIADRMHALFTGHENAHGTHGEPTKKLDSLKWEIKTTASTEKKPVTRELWEQHLTGTRPLGVVPIREDSRCSWASIDYDVYDADLIKLIRRAIDAKLPLVPVRSKSGGLHLFLFLADPQPASEVRAVLEAFAVMLGIGGSEIFPKQDEMEADRSGNWICVPYLGTTFGGKLREQTGLKKNGNEMTVQEFLHAAERARVSADAFAALPRSSGGRGDRAQNAQRAAPAPMSDPDQPFGDGPPCLQTLAGQKVQSGAQNEALLNMGIYYKRKHPEDWEKHLTDANDNFLDPVGTRDALHSTTKSLRSRDYFYGCKKEPLCSHCNVAVCRTRPFGIGGANDYPRIVQIVKWTTTPPSWDVHLHEGVVSHLTTKDLTKYENFNLACYEKLSTRFLSMAQKDWDRTLKSMPVTEKKPSADAGNDGIFRELLDEYLTDRRESSTREGIVGGAPWMDQESGVYWFRMQGLDDFLRMRNSQFARAITRDFMSDQIRALGGNGGDDAVPLKIKGKQYRVWCLPIDAFERMDGPLDTPPQLRSVI